MEYSREQKARLMFLERIKDYRKPTHMTLKRIRQQIDEELGIGEYAYAQNTPKYIY